MGARRQYTPKSSERWRQQLRAQLLNKLGWSDRGRHLVDPPPDKYPYVCIKIETVRGSNNKKIYVGFAKHVGDEVTWLGWCDPSEFPHPKLVAQLMLVGP